MIGVEKMSTETLTAEIYTVLRMEGKTKQEIKKLYGFKSMYALNKALKEMGAEEPAAEGMVEKPEFAELGSVSFQEHYAVKKQVEDLQADLAEYDRLKMVINDILHPNGDGPANPSMCDIVAYVRSDLNAFRGQISDLQTRCDELIEQSNNLVGEIEQIKENQHGADESHGELLAVNLGIKNGSKLTFHLPEHMSRKLVEDMQRPNRFSRGICAQFVNGEFIAIDMQEVVAMQVAGLSELDWAKTQTTVEQSRYRIECDCGAEYFANMYSGFEGGRNRGRCRVCTKTVFVDHQAEKVTDPADGVEAILLTNRHFIERETQEPKVVSAPPTLSDIKNIGRGYKDPCQLFG